MKASKVFTGTMQFVLLKAALGLAEIIVAMGLFALFLFLGYRIGNTNGAIIGTGLWCVVCGGGRSFLMHYVGYLIKAGHVAAVAEICKTGKTLNKPVVFGFEKVKSRFAASSVYFAVDRLVSKAVRQVQSVIGRVGGLLDFIPGMDKVTNIAQTFVGISLGYIDECCLGWCFLHEEQGAFHASCDGVVIYFQNIKHLLKSAAITTVTVIAGTAVFGVLSLALISCIGTDATIYRPVGFCAAFMLAVLFKTALIDSWMMVKMMCSYMQVAPETVITYDLYTKLCGLSSSFKKMFKKAQQELNGETVGVPAVAASGC